MSYLILAVKGCKSSSLKYPSICSDPYPVDANDDRFGWIAESHLS
jgi:hypothetical protein